MHRLIWFDAASVQLPGLERTGDVCVAQAAVLLRAVQHGYGINHFFPEEIPEFTIREKWIDPEVLGLESLPYLLNIKVFFVVVRKDQHRTWSLRAWFNQGLEPTSKTRLGFRARRGTVKKRSIHGSM
jgi:hypothetical protein